MSAVIDIKACKEMKNIYRSLGIDLNDLSPDRPWTPDGDRHLIEMYEHGWTVDMMAAEVKRARWIIVGRLWELGERGRITGEMYGWGRVLDYIGVAWKDEYVEAKQLAIV